MNENVDQSSASTDTAAPSPSSPLFTKMRISPWAFIAAAAFGLAGWQWFETRVRLADTRVEVSKRLTASELVVEETQAQSKQAQEQLATLQATVDTLKEQAEVAKSQQEALQSLYESLARNSDEAVLAEVEQNVMFAAQQLQLAGNVPGAVLALQAADSRLAGSNRPQFIELRKVLVSDLDHLRAVPKVDMQGLYLRIESVISAIDTLPLVVNARPRESKKDPVPAAAAPSLGSLSFWQQLLSGFWSDVRGLVRVQRFDREAPVLLAPEQAFFLRENLKLRLLNARLALLSRDQETYRGEIRQATEWLRRYFNGSDNAVQTAQASLKELSATEVAIALPDIAASLEAIKSYKASQEPKQ
ncbi:uroporphyrinogen-III C-methyltransferase [Propionivibrio limicola]|uniref:uroporphyrinogen-III C-methyltransferase n=1 Tax=Propionivibrio limicola TaxID=167645 RepID=UPI0012923468|nr:uroporphyrinogen-III C-methyltransferase [Propionivibrio limicola]